MTQTRIDLMSKKSLQKRMLNISTSTPRRKGASFFTFPIVLALAIKMILNGCANAVLTGCRVAEIQQDS